MTLSSVALDPSAEGSLPLGCKNYPDASQSCNGERANQEINGAHYCLLHFPGDKDLEHFKKLVRKKVNSKDYSFRYAKIPAGIKFTKEAFDGTADFQSAVFEGDADFSEAKFSDIAQFSDATFRGRVDFTHATFEKLAYFNNACFQQEPTSNDKIKDGLWTNFSGAAFESKAEFTKAHFHRITHFSDSKFKSANFRAAQFLKANFIGSRFAEAVDFGEATFKLFANFSGAVFESNADFHSAQFPGDSDDKKDPYRGGCFASAHFDTADFRKTRFSRADFASSTFDDAADFGEATFSLPANFNKVTFKSYASFSGTQGSDMPQPTFDAQSSLGLQYARIEKPDRVSFRSLNLSPEWFVNVDPTKFEFFDVEWDKEVPKRVKRSNNSHSTINYGLMSVTYRRLAINAEENHRYREASAFRFWAMDFARRERGRVNPLSLTFWYLLVSGYGESISRAGVVLLGILIGFSVLYTRVPFKRWDWRLGSQISPISDGATKKPEAGDGGSASNSSEAGDGGAASQSSDASDRNRDEYILFPRALAYSLEAVLQRSELRPKSDVGQCAVVIEIVLVSVQGALLLLAIRRKFMR